MNTEKKLHDVLYDAITTTSSYEEWIRFLRDNKLTSFFIKCFEATPQGLKFHPEFELSKHVYLLCISLHRQGRDDLLETAFMHDVGKVYATNIGNDRIYSYGHAKVSLPYIDNFQEDLKYYELTRRVTDGHMDHYEMSDPRIKNDLHMKEFVKADKSMSQVLYYEFFFQDEEKNKEKESEVYRAQRESDMTVYIAVGISGSGKSTFLRKNFDEKIIVCPDEIRREICGNISDQSKNDEVWKLAKERLLENVYKYGEAVLDATNVDKYRRICFMAAFNGCRKVALVFPANLDEAINRVNADIENSVNRSNVPAKVIKRQYNSLNRGINSLIHEFNSVRIVSGEGIPIEEIERILTAISKEKEKSNE